MITKKARDFSRARKLSLLNDLVKRPRRAGAFLLRRPSRDNRAYLPVSSVSVPWVPFELLPAGQADTVLQKRSPAMKNMDSVNHLFIGKAFLLES